jgi:hypothetical protein
MTVSSVPTMMMTRSILARRRKRQESEMLKKARLQPKNNGPQFELGAVPVW